MLAAGAVTEILMSASSAGVMEIAVSVVEATSALR